jgi:hypothetical protein
MATPARGKNGIKGGTHLQPAERGPRVGKAGVPAATGGGGCAQQGYARGAKEARHCPDPDGGAQSAAWEGDCDQSNQQLHASRVTVRTCRSTSNKLRHQLEAKVSSVLLCCRILTQRRQLFRSLDIVTGAQRQFSSESAGKVLSGEWRARRAKLWAAGCWGGGRRPGGAPVQLPLWRRVGAAPRAG